MKNFLMGILLGAAIAALSIKLFVDYSEAHETHCDKNYKLYSNYMYMVNVEAVENGFGELSLYTKEEFCKYYED